MYINLARLYPKDFVQIEVMNYFGTDKYESIYKNSKYWTSLIAELNSTTQKNSLYFDNDLYENAKCFSKELGERSLESHQRKICEKKKYAECLSYGMATGKDVAMQWLIDKDVPSLGHRKICLDSTYTKVAISVHSHKKWSTCAVAEMIW